MSKRILFFMAAAIGLLLSSCEGNNIFSDSSYNYEMEQDLAARFERYPSLRQFYAVPKGLSEAEGEALDFLYAYMPLADMTDYTTDFYLENVRASLKTRKEMGWKVPDILFRHFVLPLRVNNENLDSARVVFYKELKPRVEGLGMKDAILEVNHWCHEKLTYQPSDGRTLSPLSCVKSTLGRCGEEATFTVVALRSVGIPARQVYTPRWAHTDDNHAWVEAWADGDWYFLGACEPEPVLNLGWFNAPASRGMLMHTRAFGRYDGPEEKVLEGKNFTEINLTANYAETAKVDFKVIDENGEPVDSARVDFKIYNYAEFYPALSKYTNAEGMTFLSAGKGDMLAWASKNGAYGYSKVSFGKDSLITIKLEENHPFQTEELMIIPPPESPNLPEVSPEQRTENDRRFAREDSIRKAYMATFMTLDQAYEALAKAGFATTETSEGRVPAKEGKYLPELLVMSAGNHETIMEFLRRHPDGRAADLLGSLSHKDLKDVTLEILEDNYGASDAILCPRVENEFLSPYKSFFGSALSAEQKEYLSTPENLIKWVRDSVALDNDPKTWRIAMSPEGVWKARVADSRSRDIFFVALARTLGVEARKDPVTGKVQYIEKDSPRSAWTDVDFEAAGKSVAPTGKLVLNYSQDGGVVDNPNYYTHFSISKIANGRTQLLAFDEGQVDMGGGVNWKNVFKGGTSIDVGTYMLCSGNRVSNGSVPVTIKFFEIREGETTTENLVIREDPELVSIIGSFDSESKYYPAGSDWTLPTETKSLLSQTGRGYFALGFLGVGGEPTNHALKDIAAEKEALEAWGRPIVLLCRDEKELGRLKEELAANRYGAMPSNVIYGVDPDGALFETLQASMNLTANTKPVIIIMDTFNRVFFLSQGYTIGIGNTMKNTIAKMER